MSERAIIIDIILPIYARTSPNLGSIIVVIVYMGSIDMRVTNTGTTPEGKYYLANYVETG